ncbi:DNA repair protein RecO [Synechococcus sp. CS-602]|uniref:DNA repair protein RecO n=1 Tax=Synechococcaceae TaxID=1890426 RepID=UPI0008FF072E|nr:MULTISPECIES: DNA repair protein RecO [Synechococcaceae]MCT4363420.1 DNA repair protein RecO [Candidatus Regnicoccus frigidus MAG-AL1]APD48497.1 DNA repair protein RecO [Synechococcus sp. SynAce01]MCT0205288.1 DNA repair protein RecO [Synechococcus sp. CS-602]MCT0246782.1 DNA repair protein RecO [Synechococcus sp. CS-601]MCT4367915.1 DNA repair protein RecO [Candidatus Regnicoccus frigidus MAG-AL2]
MSPDGRLEGLCLKSGPLGENDRLLTLLSDGEGLTRLAVPGARRPRSSLAAAVPLSLLQLQVSGGSGLRRVRQLKVLRSYSQLAQRLETLAVAQALAELCLQLVPSGDGVAGVLDDLLMQLGRLEQVVKEHQPNLEALAIAVQGSVHLLALGGYGLPLQSCARSGRALEPPVGNWDWRCSLLPSLGLLIGAEAGAVLVLNASELALLQRLPRPGLPRRRDGTLIGPEGVWLRLLQLVEVWGGEHLGRRCRAFSLLRGCFEPSTRLAMGSEPSLPRNG